MKTAETKSAPSQSHNTAAKSFFNQGQEQAFFSEHSSERDSFFSSATPTPVQLKSITRETPFFSPTSVVVQSKCATCEAEEQSLLGKETSAEMPTVQRTPAFESEGIVQTKAATKAEAITSPPAIPKQQLTSGNKELEREEGATTETPQIQMMPAFSSADNSDDGDDGNADRPPVQFQLTLGQPRDAYEREADAMADRVAAISRERAAADAKTLTLAQPQRVSRKPELLMMQSDATVDWVAALKKGALGKDAKTLTLAQPQRVSRKPESLMMQSNGKPSIAPETLESRLQQAKGSGAPLDADTRTEMEEAFSSDFSGVQIHKGQEAASLNQSLGARAFTHGNNIFFNRGEYQPQSTQGKHLLAHELTHTIQQGHGVQRKVADYPSIQASQTTPDLQRVPDGPGDRPTVSSEVVDLSSGSFKPSDKVKGEIEAQGRKGLNVRTKIEGVTSEGRVKVKLDRQGNYRSIGKGSMPLLNDWAKQLGGMYVNYRVKNNQITKGYASLKEKGGNTKDWLRALKKNSAALGGLGLKVGNLPTPVNKLENGKLTLGVNDLKVEVGGFVDARFNLLLENTNKPKIDATGNINVKGIAKGVLKLDNTKEKLTGEVGLGIDLKGFKGEAKVKYKGDGTVDIAGKGAYNANKLSGEINFVATDLETANRFSKDAIKAAGGKEKVQDAPPPAPVPAAKKGSKRRALAATGQLGFNLTTWFAGTVNVVVDGNGNITAIGRINPPAEIELFKQRNWEKEIITLEARAYYGIPLVGNLNVFANIGLYALAKLGPAKIYNIEVLGTYSTDPAIQRNIQISGSLNISAYAGLRLRAEGGAGIELIGHDLRFGVGLNADVGVKAYADARPTIGYRDPGVFYFSGTLEMVAMPMLGLSGDFFIELDSPWFSPAPDKKWLWPLFSKEWPLSDPIGLNAVLKDYELGSGKVPEVEFKKPEFDPSKFMTNMVDNKLPSKSGGKAKGQSTFKEDASAPKPVVAPKKPAPKQTGTKPSKKGSQPPLGKSAKPDPKAAKAEQSMKVLADAAKKTASLKAKAPFTKTDLTKELAKIKGQVRGVDFSVKPKDAMWAITPKAGGKTGRPFEVGLQEKGKGPTDEKKHAQYLLEIKQSLKNKFQTQKHKSFEDFYAAAQKQAKILQKQYQSKLGKGLKLSIEYTPVKQDKKDGDMDIKFKIAPNTSIDTTQLRFATDERIQEVSIRALITKISHWAARNRSRADQISFHQIHSEVTREYNDHIRDPQHNWMASTYNLRRSKAENYFTYTLAPKGAGIEPYILGEIGLVEPYNKVGQGPAQVIYAHQDSGRQHVKDRIGQFIPLHLWRFTTANDMQRIASRLSVTPAEPTGTSDVSELQHVQGRYAHPGIDSPFLSLTKSNEHILNSNIPPANFNVHGRIRINMSYIPSSRIMDVGTRRGRLKYLAIHLRGGVPDPGQRQAFKDVVRTQEVLVRGEIPHAAIDTVQNQAQADVAIREWIRRNR